MQQRVVHCFASFASPDHIHVQVECRVVSFASRANMVPPRAALCANCAPPAPGATQKQLHKRALAKAVLPGSYPRLEALPKVPVWKDAPRDTQAPRVLVKVRMWVILSPSTKRERKRENRVRAQRWVLAHVWIYVCVCSTTVRYALTLKCPVSDPLHVHLDLHSMRSRHIQERVGQCRVHGLPAIFHFH